MTPHTPATSVGVLLVIAPSTKYQRLSSTVAEAAGQAVATPRRAGANRPLIVTLRAYFAATLDVIDAMTSDAILNAATRSVMRWRRAIQKKSV